MKILVTGGAGYIGSTICSALIDRNHTPIILDSLVTGRIEFTKGRIFYKGDIADKDLLNTIFNEHPDITHVVHCAALIVVPESVEHPYEYFKENVSKSLELFNNLSKLNCKNIIFSSSASIYDDSDNFMVTEKSPLNPRSPYARTKFMMEMILKDFCNSYSMKGIALRYFNPIGADPQLRTGVHVQFPSHVLGKMLSVAQGIDPMFYITGTTYNTRDGSGIRDYIHVWDLAQAHVKAIENFDVAFEKAENPSYLAINLGTGSGVTVKELVAAFEKVYDKKLNKKEIAPRPGDVPGSYANADTALNLLGWKAEKTIEEGIADALRWAEVRENIIHYYYQMEA